MCIRDSGITSFDHADIYGGYTTEADFGNAFKKSSIDREKVQYITKCGIQMPCEARPLNVKYYDYSSSHIRLSVENSLRNLKTEYIDLLLLHRPSPLMEASEICDVFYKLREEGKVNQLGVSNFTTSQIKLLQKDEEINSEINDIIDQKLSYLVENKIEKILDEKIPKLLKNYFDTK